MANYKDDKFREAVAALKEKHPTARATPYIDTMKNETWDSEQGKMSKEYGKALDEYNAPDAGAGRGKQGGPTAKELEGKAKGGSVKGWGQARGARKAKIY